jgi:DNA-binding transcriptional MerR regulator
MTVDNMTVTVYIVFVSDNDRRYGIDELADLGGVSRRTVRFYIQERLLPAPLGVGRGSHYDRTHLERLLEVKAEQEAGRSLDDIRARRRPSSGHPGLAVAAAPGTSISRSAWRRLELAPGVELHVASDVRLPAAARLDELVNWCRQHLRRNTEGEE